MRRSIGIDGELRPSGRRRPVRLPGEAVQVRDPAQDRCRLRLEQLARGIGYMGKHILECLAGADNTRDLFQHVEFALAPQKLFFDSYGLL